MSSAQNVVVVHVGITSLKKQPFLHQRHGLSLCKVQKKTDIFIVFCLRTECFWHLRTMVVSKCRHQSYEVLIYPANIKVGLLLQGANRLVKTGDFHHKQPSFCRSWRNLLNKLQTRMQKANVRTFSPFLFGIFVVFISWKRSFVSHDCCVQSGCGSRPEVSQQ